MLSKKTVEKIANQNILISDLSDDELAEFCIIANRMYRDGKSIVSDQDYDFVFLGGRRSRWRACWHPSVGTEPGRSRTGTVSSLLRQIGRAHV